MNKDNIIEFIKEKSVVTIPLIQEEFGLSYIEVKNLFDELTEKKDLEYIGGIDFRYKKTKPKPSMFITIEPERTLEERFLESLKATYDKLAAQDKLFEHKDDDERKKRVLETCIKSMKRSENEFKKDEISENSEFIDSENIDDSYAEEFDDFDEDDDFDFDEDFDDDDDLINEIEIELDLLDLLYDKYWNETDDENSKTLKVLVIKALAVDISNVCNMNSVDKWARDYSVYLILEEATGNDERNNAPHHNFWDNVYLFAMSIKELFEDIVSNELNISKADAINKVERILKGFLPRRKVKQRQVCERLIYDLKNMTDERFIYLKNYLS